MGGQIKEPNRSDLQGRMRCEMWAKWASVRPTWAAVRVSGACRPKGVTDCHIVNAANSVEEAFDEPAAATEQNVTIAVGAVATEGAILGTRGVVRRGWRRCRRRRRRARRRRQRRRWRRGCGQRVRPRIARAEVRGSPHVAVAVIGVDALNTVCIRPEPAAGEVPTVEIGGAETEHPWRCGRACHRTDRRPEARLGGGKGKGGKGKG